MNSERIRNIDIERVYKLWEEYASASNSGDFERWISLWADDGIQLAPGHPWQGGKSAIRKMMQPLFVRFEMSEMTIQIEEVRVSGDWAYSHGMYKVLRTPKDGGNPQPYAGKFLDILVKGPDGSWKIAIDCFNYDEH